MQLNIKTRLSMLSKYYLCKKINVMSNIYIGYHFTIEPLELGSEILIAELGEKSI